MAGSGTKNLIFEYTVGSGDSTAGELKATTLAYESGAAIKDASGNTLNVSMPSSKKLEDNAQIVIDTTAPSAPSSIGDVELDFKGGSDKFAELSIDASDISTIMGISSGSLPMTVDRSNAANWSKMMKSLDFAKIMFQGTAADGTTVTSNLSESDIKSIKVTSAGIELRLSNATDRDLYSLKDIGALRNSKA